MAALHAHESVDEVMRYVLQNLEFNSYHQQKHFKKRLRRRLVQMEDRHECLDKEKVLLFAKENREKSRTNLSTNKRTSTIIEDSDDETLPKKPKLQFYGKGKSTLGIDLSVPETPQPALPEITVEPPKLTSAKKEDSLNILQVKRQLFSRKNEVLNQSKQIFPDWVKKWVTRTREEKAEPSYEELEDRANNFKIRLDEVLSQNARLLQRVTHMQAGYNRYVSQHMKHSVGGYAFKQAVASLQRSCGQISLPDPNTFDVDIPNIVVDFNPKLKLSVRSNNYISRGKCGDVLVILKKTSLHKAIHEYMVLYRLKDLNLVPTPVGIVYKYSECFLVTSLIEDRPLCFSLQDIVTQSVMVSVPPCLLTEIVRKTWATIDGLHQRSFIHNNLCLSNILVSVDNSQNISVVLVGCSLACELSSAVRLEYPHTPQMSKLLSHLPLEVFTGKSPACFQSDIYCFANIIRELSVCASKCGEHYKVLSNSLKSLSLLWSGKDLSELPIGTTMSRIVTKTLACCD